MDLRLTGRENRQRRRLNAASGGDVEAAMARIEAGQRSGRIQAHQPIGLRPALGGIGERAHLCVAAQRVPCLKDGVVGHRLHPQASHRFGDGSDIEDVAENEFTFAAGVAGVDDAIHVLALGELENLLQAGLRVQDRIQIKIFRDSWQDVEFPRQFFAVGSHGHSQFDEVSDGGGDDSGVVFVENIAA